MPDEESFVLRPIGWVRSSRRRAIDDGWDAESACVVLDERRFAADALAGLADFSHVEVVFVFHQLDDAAIHLGARRPRHNPDWPEVGIFAQRGRARPNRLGVTTCELLAVDGLEVRVAGLDAVDGTPVLDLKPWVAEFAPRSPTRQPTWMSELMAGYW